MMTQWIKQDIRLIHDSPCVDWDSLRHGTVLVTGATGLIGSMVVRALLYHQEADMTVLALVRNPEKAEAMFARERSNPRLKLVVGDVTQMPELPLPVDYIIHGASVTASRYMVSNPVETLKTAIAGTESILELARHGQVKGMVYLSSMEAYGITDPQKPYITEADLGYIDILNPRSSYSEGKRICECLCAAYAHQYQLPVKIARLAQTFGAGVPENDTRVFAQFAKSAMAGTDIVLRTPGTSFGNYCYTADVVTALLCLLTKGTPAEAYTVVNESTTMQIRDMAALVAREIGKGAVRVVFDIPENGAALGYAPDSTMHLSGKKLNALGWQATYGLKEMYQRMIGDWQEKSQEQ